MHLDSRLSGRAQALTFKLRRRRWIRFLTTRSRILRRWSSPRTGVLTTLTANEAKVLRYFADHADRVILREELLNDVWGDAHVTSRTVDTQVMKLRQNLELDPARPVHLRTLYGIGYKSIGGK